MNMSDMFSFQTNVWQGHETYGKYLKGCLHWPTSDNREGLILMPRNLSQFSWQIVNYYPLDYVKHFYWITITHSWGLSSFRKFNIESIEWLRLIKIVQQFLIIMARKLCPSFAWTLITN